MKNVYSIFNPKQPRTSFGMISDANIIPTNHTIYKLFIYGL